jgi:hypothetical protein
MAEVEMTVMRRDYQSIIIPTEPLQDFRADQILVREIDWSKARGNHYRWIDQPKPYTGDDDLMSLVRRVATSDNWHDDVDYEERHLLDIPIHRDSYIVLKMDRHYGHFVEPGVTLNWPNNIYGGRRQVSELGTISSTWPTDGVCKVIYFQAEVRVGTSTRPYIQGISYHPPEDISFPLDYEDRRPIDPDIRYPGNGGQP